MNLKLLNKIDTNRYELTIEVNAEDFEKELQNVYKKQKNKITIPGFRKGKASRSFIEKFYGRKVFYEDAINNIYPHVVDEAIDQAQLDVIEDKIDFDLIRAEEDGLEFKVALTVKPEVEIENYKGIEIKPKNSEVTDEDINNEIQSIRDRNSRIIKVEDRSVENGDIVIIDFEGYLDDEPFEGGKSNNYSLTIGAGQFIPGFEEQLIGHNTNDEFDVIVTFPEEYHSKNIAGKEAKFKIKLHEIKKKELPELDDEFVKDVSDFDTLDEYKEDLKIKVKERKEKESELDCENQIITKLVDLVKAEIPKAMIENEINQQMNDLEHKLNSQGVNIDMYTKYLNIDINDLRENFRNEAEKKTKILLALEKIVELENIIPNEIEISDSYDEMAKENNMNLEKLKSIVSEENMIKDIAVKKALAIVRENAIMID